jgi:hypothetical protein
MDKFYVQWRNSFIPQAEKYANMIAGKRPHKKKASDTAVGEWGDKWNRLFHGKMKELTSEAYS